MFTFEVPSIDPALPARPFPSPTLKHFLFSGFYSLEGIVFGSFLSLSLAESDVYATIEKDGEGAWLRTNKIWACCVSASI